MGFFDFFKKKVNCEKDISNSRIAKIKSIGTEWHGLVVSIRGDNIVELRPGKTIKVGDWLYFLFRCKSGSDGRIVISDSACLWLKIPHDIELAGGSNVYNPIPNEIYQYIISDGSYSNWIDAFDAINKWFASFNNWAYQWSSRTDRVKQFMTGINTGWVSQ